MAAKQKSATIGRARTANAFRKKKKQNQTKIVCGHFELVLFHEHISKMFSFFLLFNVQMQADLPQINWNCQKKTCTITFGCCCCCFAILILRENTVWTFFFYKEIGTFYAFIHECQRQHTEKERERKRIRHTNNFNHNTQLRTFSINSTKRRNRNEIILSHLFRSLLFSLCAQITLFLRWCASLNSI